MAEIHGCQGYILWQGVVTAEQFCAVHDLRSRVLFCAASSVSKVPSKSGDGENVLSHISTDHCATYGGAKGVSVLMRMNVPLSSSLFRATPRVVVRRRSTKVVGVFIFFCSFLLS